MTRPLGARGYRPYRYTQAEWAKRRQGGQPMTDNELQALSDRTKNEIYRAWRNIRDQLCTLEQEVHTLRAAIRQHRDARGHARCWQNDLELYAVLGEGVPYDPALPCREEFLQRCAEYYQQQSQEHP